MKFICKSIVCSYPCILDDKERMAFVRPDYCPYYGYTVRWEPILNNEDREIAEEEG